MEIAVGAKDFLDGRRTVRADQLSLQIGDAHVEAELLHFRSSEVGPDTGALESPAEHRLLAGIAETCEPQASRPWAELVEEGSEAVRASQLNNPDARCKIDAAALSQRFDRALVTRSLDNHNRACVRPI